MRYVFIISFLLSQTLFGGFACVDFSKLIEKNTAYLDLMKKLENTQSEHKSEIEKIDNDLALKHKTLIEGQSSMSQKDREDKTQEYQTGVEKSRARKQELRLQYDEMKEGVMKTILQNAEIVTQELRLEQKYDAILYKNAIYVNGNIPDITDDLIEKMNKRQ
jgi:Skp family chaperone for outer membrane proteins